MDLGKLRIDGAISYLVPFSERHLEDPSYLAWLRDHEVIKTLNLPEYLDSSPGLEDARAYFQALRDSANEMFLALYDKSDNLFVGSVRVGHIDWRSKVADLGIMIGRRERWGRGLASDAISAVACYLFDTVGMRKLSGGAMANNVAMVRIFEKLGFRREGVFRAQDYVDDDYVDHIYFGCFRDELIVSSPPATAQRTA